MRMWDNYEAIIAACKDTWLIPLWAILIASTPSHIVLPLVSHQVIMQLNW
jgi:hypothetical protein